MPRNPRDPKGYYQILNLSPGASGAEVKLAYTFLKNAWQRNRKLPRARIKEAYDCLVDDEARIAYHRGAAAGFRSDRGRSLAVTILLAGLLAFAGFVFPGFLLPGPAPFTVGDELTALADGAPLGRIAAVDPRHVFPNGGNASAYLVELPDGGRRWYPTGDLERHYRRR